MPLMREMCAHCGTLFDLERKPSGEVGRIESCRWVKWTPYPRTRRQRLRWWLAAYAYDLATWLSL